MDSRRGVGDNRPMQFIDSRQLPFVPASHEDPQNPGAFKRVLFTKDAIRPGVVQMVNWARMAPGKAFAPHYHQDMQEVFVMIAGRVEMTVAGRTLTLQPGDAVLVEPGEVHRMRNTGDQDVQYVVLGVSAGQGGQTVVVDE